MKDYKVTITLFDHTGLLPDLFGKRKEIYVQAESANDAYSNYENKIKAEFGHEIELGQFNYKIDIESV